MAKNAIFSIIKWLSIMMTVLGKLGITYVHELQRRKFHTLIKKPPLHFKLGMALHSRSRVYCEVNAHNQRDYWDYESYVVDWG